MTETSELDNLFQKYANKQQLVELWAIPQMLKDLNINLQEEELFNIVFEMDIHKAMTILQLKNLIFRIQNKSDTLEAENDIVTAWIALNGQENKLGVIKTSDLQKMSDKYKMELNFEQILHKYYRQKNIMQYQTQEIGYQVFKDIMAAGPELID
ncbi:Dynein_light chain [Hexamita inflata]|uniref:Dynein light chain n=1 Tax=Hexamita inflata TaxID=28002 RepID=A0AA86NFQ9_9EUKA|nr:Dynein light chain [Hexamita inflata]